MEDNNKKDREKQLLLVVLILAIVGIGIIYIIESNKQYNIKDISTIQKTTITTIIAVTTTTTTIPIITTTTVPTTVTTTTVSTSTFTSIIEISTTTTLRKNPMLERFSGKGYRQVTIKADLYCPSCVEGLTYLLKSKSGVISTDVNYFNDMAKIIYDPKKITKEEVATLVGSVGDAVIVDDVEI